jgi:hypothetical protein
MPIKLSKAREILQLNYLEGGPKMPPDVKESLALAMNAMDAIKTIRQGTTVDILAPLKNEEPE